MIEVQERRTHILKIRKRWALSLALTLSLFVLYKVTFCQQKPLGPAGQASTNVQFSAGHQALNIPFEFVDNQIILNVRVNDSAPLKFMFDTGAGGSLLSAGKAAELHLIKVGSARANGIGGSKEGYQAAASLGVPGVKVLNQRIFVVPLEGLPCEMRDVVGIIVYYFIKEFVVEINYETQTISLVDPSSY